MLSVDLPTKIHPLVFVATFFLISYSILSWKSRHNRGKFPPGPKGIPFFGNALQISQTPWRQYEAWKKEFGDLVYVTVGNQGILVLNTQEAATELLDRKGHLYSNRPQMVLPFKIMLGGLSLGTLDTTGVFRRMRRATREALSRTQATEYYSLQMKTAATMVGNLLQKPDDWEHEFRRAAASMIMSLVYDYPEVKSVRDPLVEKFEVFIEELKDLTMPGSHLVEFIPWMIHLPSSIAGWKRRAEKFHREYFDLYSSLFHDVEKRIKEGDERPSFASTLIRERDRYRLQDAEKIWLSATLYIAGFDTMTSLMHWFMLAMIVHPEKQKKCQDELDAVVGRERMPTFQDRDHLPYVRAAVREILRWRAVAPLGFPHYSREDGWYQDYFIPKGTICIANVWSMNRDRDLYGEDADEFNPDRFIDDNGQLSPALQNTKDGHVAYGFGPRSCPGRHMANNNVFIAIASILWAMNISAVKDENGKPIIPDTLEATEGRMTIRPLSFQFSITPRFPEVSALVARTRECLL